LDPKAVVTRRELRFRNVPLAELDDPRDLAVKAYPWVKAPPGFAAPAGARTTCVAELTDGFRCFGDPVILEHRYERLGA
jgi:hypothetical protein